MSSDATLMAMMTMNKRLFSKQYRGAGAASILGGRSPHFRNPLAFPGSLALATRRRFSSRSSEASLASHVS